MIFFRTVDDSTIKYHHRDRHDTSVVLTITRICTCLKLNTHAHTLIPIEFRYHLSRVFGPDVPTPQCNCTHTHQQSNRKCIPKASEIATTHCTGGGRLPGTGSTLPQSIGRIWRNTPTKYPNLMHKICIKS